MLTNPSHSAYAHSTQQMLLDNECFFIILIIDVAPPDLPFFGVPVIKGATLAFEAEREVIGHIYVPVSFTTSASFHFRTTNGRPYNAQNWEGQDPPCFLYFQALLAQVLQKTLCRTDRKIVPMKNHHQA